MSFAASRQKTSAEWRSSTCATSDSFISENASCSRELFSICSDLQLLAELQRNSASIELPAVQLIAEQNGGHTAVFERAQVAHARYAARSKQRELACLSDVFDQREIDAAARALVSD